MGTRAKASRAGSLATVCSNGHRGGVLFGQSPAGKADQCLVCGLVALLPASPVAPAALPPLSSRALVSFSSLRKEHHKPTKLVFKRVGGLVFGVVLWPFVGGNWREVPQRKGTGAIVTPRGARTAAQCPKGGVRNFSEGRREIRVGDTRELCREPVVKRFLVPGGVGHRPATPCRVLLAFVPANAVEGRGERGAGTPRGTGRGTPANPQLPG
jgi:hypothetical protein